MNQLQLQRLRYSQEKPVDTCVAARIKFPLWQRKLLESEQEQLHSYLEALQESLAVGTDSQPSEVLEPACKRTLQYRQRRDAASIDSFDGLAQ